MEKKDKMKYEHPQRLLNFVLEQLKIDIDIGEQEAIEEMVKGLTEDDLIAYLPEQTQRSYYGGEE